MYAYSYVIMLLASIVSDCLRQYHVTFIDLISPRSLRIEVK